MPETSDPTTPNAAVLHALEEENRVLREQLAAGHPLGPDLRLLRLTEELRQENLRLTADSQALGAKNIELVFQVEELEDKLGASLEEGRQLEEARSEAEGQRRDLERRLEEALADSGQLRADLETAGRELQQAQAVVAQASEELEAARTQAGEQERLAGELRQAGEGARAESTRLAAELESTQARIATLEAELESTQARTATLAAELESTQARTATLEAEAQRTIAELEHQLQSVRSGAEDLRAEARESQRRVEELEHQLQSVRSGVEDLRAEARESQQRVEELEARMGSAREVLEARNTRLEELERSLAEAVELAERRAAELQEATAEGQRLHGALQAAEAKATAFESTLAQVQEQFVTRVEQEHRRPSTEGDLAGAPHLALSGLMGSLLGGGGSMLVEKVYARCGVDPESREPAELERVLASLEEKASRLLSTADQRTRLQEMLARVRARVQAGWEASAPVEAPPVEQAPASPAGEPEQATARVEQPPASPAGEPEQATARVEQAPASPAGEPEQATARVEQPPASPAGEPEQAAAAVEKAPASPAGEPEQAAAAVEQAPALAGEPEQPAPEAVATPDGSEGPAEPVPAAPEEAAPAKGEAPEEAASAKGEAPEEAASAKGEAREEAAPARPEGHDEASEAPAAVEAEAAPELLLPPEEGSLVFEEVQDPAVRTRIDEAMDLLAHENFDQSWESLQKLAAEHPSLLEVQEGLFHNYAASFCWVEACDIGRRISASALRGPRRGRFVPAMHDVLVERLKAVRDLGERKRLFLELAELHLGEPDEARELLGRALAIHQRTPADARIDFYMTRLLEGRAEDRLRHVLGALEGVADDVRLFDDLDQVSQDKRHRVLRPATGVILALLRRGREAAGEVEKEAGGLLAPSELDPTLVEELHDDEADLVVEFVLNQLLPKAGQEIPFPAPAFQALLAGSQPVPAGWKPAELLDRLNHRLFRIRDVRSHLHSGGADFWLAASPEPVPEAVFHPDLAGLPSAEQQFLVLRTLFQLHHRHFHVWRAAEVLDDESRCRLLGLTRDIVQETGTDVSDSLEREIDSLKPGRPDLGRTISELLDRLYYHCLREEFLLLKDFFFSTRPFAARLERASDRFGARLVGLTAASYGVARECVGRSPLFKQLEEEGFGGLYDRPLETHRALRLRLQRLWLAPLQEE